jgi:hypothetical protein
MFETNFSKFYFLIWLGILSFGDVVQNVLNILTTVMQFHLMFQQADGHYRQLPTSGGNQETPRIETDCVKDCSNTVNIFEEGT